jgi:hypothetical protein
VEFGSFNSNLFNPFKVDSKPIKVCPIGTPMFLNTVLSVRSRCNLDNGSLAERCSKMAFAIPKFPSSFQSQSGCGIADDPISPALFLFEIFHGNIGPRYLCPMIMVFILFKASKMLQSDRNVRFVWSGKRVV